jgi:hypothetical protein
MLVAIIAIALSRPDIRRPLIPALLVAGVILASYVNSIPLYKFYYPTTQNYLLFWINAAISSALGVMFSALQVFLLLLGAYCLMRFVWPRQDRILARGPKRWVDFSRSAWRGLMFGGVMMAYVVLFYQVTTNYLGWWAPITSEYSDIFATPFAFVYALEAGLSAAMIEELSIRLIGIGFFLWLFRGRFKWFAVLIPSVIWAFAHSSYVTSPIYARGVELTIVAIFLGIVFLKFDLLTTIMSHFTYNMMITGIVLLRSSDRYYQISGWIIILFLILPLLPGLYLELRRRLGKESTAPESLVLSPFESTDLEGLSALPVKADWSSLTAQPNRETVCLRASAEILGVATGFVDDRKNGYIDGVYVQHHWRRQYWGAALLDAVQEALVGCGAGEVRVLIKPEENRSRSFFHNLFWRTRVQILGPNEPAPRFEKAIQTLFSDLKKDKSAMEELEIPGNLV